MHPDCSQKKVPRPDGATGTPLRWSVTAGFVYRYIGRSQVVGRCLTELAVSASATATARALEQHLVFQEVELVARTFLEIAHALNGSTYHAVELVQVVSLCSYGRFDGVHTTGQVSQAYGYLGFFGAALGPQPSYKADDDDCGNDPQRCVAAPALVVMLTVAHVFDGLNFEQIFCFHTFGFRG